MATGASPSKLDSTFDMKDWMGPNLHSYLLLPRLGTAHGGPGYHRQWIFEALQLSGAVFFDSPGLLYGWDQNQLGIHLRCLFTSASAPASTRGFRGDTQPTPALVHLRTHAPSWGAGTAQLPSWPVIPPGKPVASPEELWHVGQVCFRGCPAKDLRISRWGA